MGIDACIYVKLKKGSEIDYIEEALTSISIRGLDATHEVNVMYRYYSPIYPKGDWPQLFKILSSCFREPDVLKVFYLSDCILDSLEDQETTIEETTIEEISELCVYYMSNKRTW